MTMHWPSREEEAEFPLCPCCQTGGLISLGVNYPMVVPGWWHFCDMCGALTVVSGMRFNRWFEPIFGFFARFLDAKWL